jgi:hypothetical protein
MSELPLVLVAADDAKQVCYLRYLTLTASRTGEFRKRCGNLHRLGRLGAAFSNGSRE